MRITAHAAAWLVWWSGLFWLFLLLAGDWNRIELAAAACVAAVGATVAERLRTAADVRPRVPFDLLREVPKVPLVVLADFGVVVWALAVSLARRRVVRGRFRARELAPEQCGDDPAGAARRAWTVLLAGYSPNAYVVDLDPERRTVLLHDLVPWRKSEEPA